MSLWIFLEWSQGNTNVFSSSLQNLQNCLGGPRPPSPWSGQTSPPCSKPTLIVINLWIPIPPPSCNREGARKRKICSHRIEPWSLRNMWKAYFVLISHIWSLFIFFFGQVALISHMFHLPSAYLVALQRFSPHIYPFLHFRLQIKPSLRRERGEDPDPPRKNQSKCKKDSDAKDAQNCFFGILLTNQKK